MMSSYSSYSNLPEPVDRGECGETPIVESMALVMSWIIFILTFPFSLIFCLEIVQPYETPVVFRMGRLKSAEINRVFIVLPCIETCIKVDTRSRAFKVPAQEVLTKDQVTVAVDAVLHYRVSNVMAAMTKIEDPHESTKRLAQSALRGAMGKLELHDLLRQKDSINLGMNLVLALVTVPWGIKIESIEITDIRLPPQLQRPMAAAGEAAREAKAKVVAAEGELNASRALKAAAEVLGESKGAIQLRYLQTLAAISIDNNATVIFPMPVRWSSSAPPGSGAGASGDPSKRSEKKVEESTKIFKRSRVQKFARRPWTC